MLCLLFNLLLFIYRLWRHVTHALRNNDIHNASIGKQWLEQRQRLEQKDRAQKNVKWMAKVRRLFFCLLFLFLEF